MFKNEATPGADISIDASKEDEFEVDTFDENLKFDLGG